MVRVLLVDDHVLVRAGIRSLMLEITDVEVVAEAGNGVDALALVALHKPDLVLMDIAMAPMNGLEATAAINRDYPDVQVIILSMYINEAYVEQALRAGAHGYLIKDTDVAEMSRAIEAVMRDEIYLDARVSKQLVESFLKRSPAAQAAPEAAPAAVDAQLTARQREVLRDIAQGLSTREIASSLGISHKTVEAHRTQIMERLGIRDVPGLVRYAIRTGLITLD